VPATFLHSRLLLAGDIHLNPGPVWLCPACSRSAARGSFLCTTCHQWWHLSCAGLRCNRNLSSGWTCQPCSTISTQLPPAPPSALFTCQPVTSTTAPVTRLHSTSLSTSGSSSGPPHTSASTYRILQLSLAGLRSRQVELLKYLQDEHIDVACIQETNLGGGAEPPRLSGWQLVGRMDRRVNRDGQPTRTHHGGVAFRVEKASITRTSQMLPLQLSLRTIAQLNVRPSRSMTLAWSNLSPSSTCMFLLFGASMVRTSVSIRTSFQLRQILSFLGYFNAYSLTWDPNSPEDPSGEELDDWAILGDLVVLNDGSLTQVSSHGIASAPDITFVLSVWEQHLTWRTGIHIGSDHFPIIIAHGGSHTNQSRRKATFSYKMADWPTFQETLDLSLSQWELPSNQRSPSERFAIFSHCSCSQEGHSERISENPVCLVVS